MIQKVEMYQAVCDGCGKRSRRYALQSKCRRVLTTFYGWREIGGKLYCPDCVEYDKETKSYKPKEKKP